MLGFNFFFASVGLIHVNHTLCVSVEDAALLFGVR